MPQPGEAAGAQALYRAGIGRPLSPESATAFTEAFDRIMPGPVRIALRQFPGIFYVGPSAFAESNPGVDLRDKPSVEAKIGEIVTSLCDKGELSSEALELATPSIHHFTLGKDDRVLKMKVRDRGSYHYTDGYLFRGERAAFVKTYGMPQLSPVRNRGEAVEGSYVALGIVTRGENMVTQARLKKVGNFLDSVTVEPIGVVTSS